MSVDIYDVVLRMIIPHLKNDILIEKIGIKLLEVESLPHDKRELVLGKLYNWNKAILDIDDKDKATESEVWVESLIKALEV